MGRQYRVCPFCGDHLDAGEICGCRRETDKTKGECTHEHNTTERERAEIIQDYCAGKGRKRKKG